MSKSVCLSNSANSSIKKMLLSKHEETNSSNQYKEVGQLIHKKIVIDDKDEEALFENDYDAFDSQKNFVDNEESCPGSTDADSEEDYESHFEALDELSEILCVDNSNVDRNVKGSIAPFERPSNPIIFNCPFYIQRCSAPAFFESEMNPNSIMKASNVMFSGENGSSFAR